MSWPLVAVALGVAAALVVVGVISIALVRWARRNRARAAEMMLGTYLENQVMGVPLEGEPGWLDTFTTWLGDCVDSISDSAAGGDGDAGDGCDYDTEDAGCSD